MSGISLLKHKQTNYEQTNFLYLNPSVLCGVLGLRKWQYNCNSFTVTNHIVVKVAALEPLRGSAPGVCTTLH